MSFNLTTFGERPPAVAHFPSSPSGANLASFLFSYMPGFSCFTSLSLLFCLFGFGFCSCLFSLKFSSLGAPAGFFFLFLKSQMKCLLDYHCKPFWSGSSLYVVFSTWTFFLCLVFWIHICLFTCLFSTSLLDTKLCEDRAYGYGFQLPWPMLSQYHLWYILIEALNIKWINPLQRVALFVW